MGALTKSIIAKQLEISCAKRRKIILDGSAAASWQLMFAPETSPLLAIMDSSHSCTCSGFTNWLDTVL
jgi:hypothetical protein